MSLPIRMRRLAQAELDRRYEDYVSGKDPGIPLAELRRMMQKQFENGDLVDERYGADRPIIRDRTEASAVSKSSSDPESTAELKRRWAEYESGKETTISLEEVYRRTELQLAAENATDA